MKYHILPLLATASAVYPKISSAEPDLVGIPHNLHWRRFHRCLITAKGGSRPAPGLSAELVPLRSRPRQV